MIRVLVPVLLLLVVACGQAQAQLRGHGGPVRALAISPDDTQAVSGSFDTSAIRWSMTASVPAPACTMTMMRRGRAKEATNEVRSGAATKVPSWPCATTTSSVRAVLRLKIATT